MSFALPSSRVHLRGSWRRAPHRPLRVLSATPDSGAPKVKPTENGAHREKAKDAVETVVKPAAASIKKAPKPVTAKVAPSTKPYSNKLRFVVPTELRSVFDKVWDERRSSMEKATGFEGMKIDDGSLMGDGSREVTVVSEWASIPEWETYSCSDAARRSHLPPGIYQYVPKKGEGFPEDFTPFIDYADIVQAKY